MSDTVNGPAHYVYSDIEPIAVIEAWRLDFCLGNAIKYIARCDHKGSKVADLQKAAWYVARAIERAKIEVGLVELAANAPKTERMDNAPKTGPAK